MKKLFYILAVGICFIVSSAIVSWGTETPAFPTYYPSGTSGFPPTLALTDKSSGNSIYTVDYGGNGLPIFIDPKQMLLSGNSWMGLRAVNNTTYSTGATKTGYNPITGLIQDYSANEPVIAYLREGDTKGMMGFDLNAAVTNYVINSTNLTAVDWVYTRSGVTNKGAAPDGSENAFFFAADGINGTHFTYQLINKDVFADNVHVLFSAHIQASTLDWVRLWFNTKANNARFAYFNLSTGAIGTTSGVSEAWISKDTYNGAYRIYISAFTESGANNLAFEFDLAETDGDVSFQLPGSGVTIWGPMISQTAWLPPYIPTDSAIALYTSDSGNPYFGMPPVMSDALAEVLGGEEIVNGDFSSDVGWIIGGGWVISGNSAQGTLSGSLLYRNVTLIPGELYKCSVDVDVRTAGSLTFYINGKQGASFTTVDTHVQYIVARTSGGFLGVNANGFTGVIDNLSVEQVTNARISDKLLWPPHGEVEVYWVPYFDYGDSSSGSKGIISTSDTSGSILLNNGSGGSFGSFDGTTVVYLVGINWSAFTLYKLIVQFGYLIDNVSYFRLCSDSGSGLSCGSDTKYDGSFTTGGNGLQFFYSGFGRSIIGPIRFWNRIRSDAEINGEGSP